MIFIPLSEGSTDLIRFAFSEPGLALMPVSSSLLSPSPFTVTTLFRYLLTAYMTALR